MQELAAGLLDIWHRSGPGSSGTQFHALPSPVIIVWTHTHTHTVYYATASHTRMLCNSRDNHSLLHAALVMGPHYTACRPGQAGTRLHASACMQVLVLAYYNPLTVLETGSY